MWRMCWLGVFSSSLPWPLLSQRPAPPHFFFFPSLLRSSLELSDTKVYEHYIRARLGNMKVCILSIRPPPLVSVLVGEF